MASCIVASAYGLPPVLAPVCLMSSNSAAPLRPRSRGEASSSALANTTQAGILEAHDSMCPYPYRFSSSWMRARYSAVRMRGTSNADWVMYSPALCPSPARLALTHHCTDSLPALSVLLWLALIVVVVVVAGC